MRFNILSDADWDSRVDKVLDSLSDFRYRKVFEEGNYGDSVDGITVVLMCRNSDYNFKQRIRFSKKEKKLYLDIMLDLNIFRSIDQDQREKIIAEKLVLEVPEIIMKYKFPDFDLMKFKKDLITLFKKIKWL